MSLLDGSTTMIGKRALPLLMSAGCGESSDLRTRHTRIFMARLHGHGSLRACPPALPGVPFGRVPQGTEHLGCHGRLKERCIASKHWQQRTRRCQGNNNTRLLTKSHLHF